MNTSGSEGHAHVFVPRVKVFLIIVPEIGLRRCLHVGCISVLFAVPLRWVDDLWLEELFQGIILILISFSV